MRGPSSRTGPGTRTPPTSSRRTSSCSGWAHSFNRQVCWGRRGRPSGRPFYLRAPSRPAPIGVTRAASGLHPLGCAAVHSEFTRSAAPGEEPTGSDLRSSCAAKGGKRITMATILPEEFGSRRLDAVGPAVVEDREIDLRSILGMLRRRKSVIFGTVAAVLLLTLLVLIQLTPRYTSSAELMLNTRQQNVVDIETVVSGLNTDPGAFQTGVQSEINIITSRSLARRVVEKLGLMQDPEFNASLRQRSALDYVNPLYWVESGARWAMAAVGLGAQRQAPEEPRTAEEEETAALSSVIGSFLGHLK